MFNKNKYKLPVVKLLPNFITILSLVFGISSLRFALNDRWHEAILCILFAGLLDGLDGRLARLLNASTALGAQLDSLCDFINFGVMPGLLLYFWSLRTANYTEIVVHSHELICWSATLFYIMCMAFRLARFNIISSEINIDKKAKFFFIGVPAPVGAFLVLTPIMVSFEVSNLIPLSFYKDWRYLSLHLIINGVLLASRLPTFSIKYLHVSAEYIWLILMIFAISVLAISIYCWYILPLLSFIYILTLPISYLIHKKIKF